VCLRANEGFVILHVKIVHRLNVRVRNLLLRISVTDYFEVNRGVYQIQETLMEMKFKFQQNTKIKLININRKRVFFLRVISINESLNLRTGLH